MIPRHFIVALWMVLLFLSSTMGLRWGVTSIAVLSQHDMKPGCLGVRIGSTWVLTTASCVSSIQPLSHVWFIDPTMGDVALNHTQLVLKNYARINQIEIFDKYRNYVGSDRVKYDLAIVKYDLAIVKLEPYVEQATIRTVTLPFGGIPNPETMKQVPGDAIITVDPKTLGVWVTDIAYGDNALCGLPFSNSNQSEAAGACVTTVTQGNEPRLTNGTWSFLVRKRENINKEWILGFKSPRTRPHDSFHAYSWISATVSKWITPGKFVGVNAVKYNPSS